MIYLFDRAKKLQKIIPRKHIINATQTKVRNGIYQLAVEVPIFYETKQGTHYNHQKSVEKAEFAGHYDDKNRFQLYKIYSRNITANEQGEFLLFDGVHIFFDEAKAMGNIHDRRWRDSEAKAPADAAFNSIGWTVIDYDVTDRHDINFYRASVTDAWNDLISTYGVEFDYELQFDGRKIVSKNIIMKKQLGKWTGQRFAYGTNVLTLTQEQDESEVYTAAVGRGRGEESGDGFGPRLEFGDIEWSKDGITKPVGRNYIEIPSATAEFGFVENGVVKPRIAPEVIFEDIEDKKLLAESTYQWLLENCIPKATWKTEVARIGKLSLGDTVGVLYKAAGIIKRTRVEKIEYNLLDPELSKLTLGDFHHFENRQMKRINAQIKRLGRDSNDRITRIKNEWNAWIDNQFIAAKNELEQAIIDANAEVEAMRVEMTDEIASVLKDMSEKFESEKHSAYEDAQRNYDAIDEKITTEIDTTRSHMESVFNQSVAESKQYAEQQAQEKVDSVQSNLDSFKDSHQQLYDEVTGNVMDIDAFLGDKSVSLKQQFDKVRTDFGTLQTELDDVETDLSTAKTDLQKQLDDVSKDTNEKVTQINQRFDNVDGQLSAKLEQTDIEPINKKITEYGNTLTANAQSIQSLLDKTELHNGDITKWSNKTTETAEGLEQTISRVSSTEGKMSKAQADIVANTNEIATKVSSVDFNELKGTVSDNSSAISQTANEIKAKVTQAEVDYSMTHIDNGSIKTVKDVASFYNGGHTVKGALLIKTNITGRAMARVYIKGYNYQTNNSNIDAVVSFYNYSSSILQHSYTSTGSKEIGRVRLFRDSDGIVYILLNDFDSTWSYPAVVVDRFDMSYVSNWTWGDDWAMSIVDSMPGDVANLTEVRGQDYGSIVSKHDTELIQNAKEIALKASQSELQDVTGRVTSAESKLSVQAGEINAAVNRIGATETGIESLTTDFSIEAGKVSALITKTDGHTSQLADITAETTGIKQSVLDITKDYVKQSFVNVTADKVTIGSTVVNGNTIGSVLSVSPTGIDAVAKAMRLSGDLYVDGDITALAVNVIEGNFARLFANQVEANVIDVDHINGRTAWFERLYILSTNVNRLTAQHVFTDAVHTKSLDAIEANIGRVRTAFLKADVIEGRHIAANTIEIKHLTGYDAILEMLMARSVFSNQVTTLSLNAVEANIGSIRSQILTSNVIRSQHIQSGNALIDKIFSSTGMFERMMAKSGFVSTLNTVSIDTDQLTIRRADGGVLMSNGTQKFGSPIITKPFPSTSVTFDGVNYVTSARGSQTFERAYGEHSGRYANFSVRYSLRHDSDDVSSKIGIVIRPGTMPSGVSVGTVIEEVTAFKSRFDSKVISVRLPVPTFGAMSWTLEFYRIGDSVPNYVQIRSERCWISA